MLNLPAFLVLAPLVPLGLQENRTQYEKRNLPFTGIYPIIPFIL